MRAIYFLVPILFLCLGALFFLGLNREKPNTLPSEMIGRDAPPLSLGKLGEKPHFDQSDLQGGGIKVLNVFASWCVPCRVEHPNIQTLTDLGLPVYGMNYKDRPEAALAFLKELGDPYTGIGTDEGRNGIEWGVYGVPETFLIDGEGKVLYRFAGPVTRRVLEAEILPLLQ
ncbi:MAG: DsbE family thiol:disulfide interchange protein [Pseudomonadota bacterium]